MRKTKLNVYVKHIALVTRLSKFVSNTWTLLGDAQTDLRSTVLRSVEVMKFPLDAEIYCRTQPVCASSKAYLYSACYLVE